MLSVVGNRPQFIKSAPLSEALREPGIEEVVVHTGQHYDPELSQVFFEELGLPEPRYRLDVGGLGRDEMLEALRPGLADPIAAERPDWVLVYGDTNSTLGGARAAVEAGVPLAHVEAGLRSYDLSMPEEHNRVETDRLSQLLFAPDERSRAILEGEGVAGRVEVVGDVMMDANLRLAPIARQRSSILDMARVSPGRYIVATLHREANVAEPRLAAHPRRDFHRIELPVVFPAHPRTAAAIADRTGSDARQCPVDPAARLPRLRRPRIAGSRDRHRLRRPPERGLLVRRAMRDDTTVDGMGRHRRGRRERARRRRPRAARRGGCERRACRPSGLSSTATGTPQNASRRALYPSRPE